MSLPKHVAIIMDGNGRWAKQHHQPRIYGHKIGADNIRNIVEATIQNKIKYLTLFAFSCENWNRPKKEVTFLMELIDKKISEKLIDDLNKKKIRFKWIGMMNKISPHIVKKLHDVETRTITNTKLVLTIAFNYGGRQDILQACNKMQSPKTFQQFDKLLLTAPLPDVDLVIRTGNEKRISNFLLWQSAYAEIIFEPTFWPAYNKNIFAKNILEYCGRTRRFGKIIND